MATSFDDWFKTNQAKASDTDVNFLAQFLANTTSPLPEGAEAVDYAKSILAADLSKLSSGASHGDAIAALVRLQRRWTRKADGGLRGILSGITIGGVALCLFGIVTGLVLIFGVFSPQFIAQLANADRARGIITFIFSIATISIFLLVSIAIFWSPVELEGRFTNAKDLLTILVGILGTIMGFYFASSNATAPPPLSINTLSLSKPIVSPGGELILTASLTGGTTPYIYSVRFSDPSNLVQADVLDKLPSIKGKPSLDGKISEAIKTPSELFAPSSLIVTVTAEDDRGRQARQDTILTVTPDGAKPPAADASKPSSAAGPDATPPAASAKQNP